MGFVEDIHSYGDKYARRLEPLVSLHVQYLRNLASRRPARVRARNHREHVDGDYRNPPEKGKYVAIHAQSKAMMARQAVRLTRQQIDVALNEVIASLQKHNIKVIVVSLDDHHLHLLGRFNDNNPRKWLGIAKKDVSLRLLSLGIGSKGGVWAARSKSLPIASRRHQLKTVAYIISHESRRAVVRRVWKESKS